MLPSAARAWLLPNLTRSSLTRTDIGGSQPGVIVLGRGSRDDVLCAAKGPMLESARSKPGYRRQLCPPGDSQEPCVNQS